MGNRHQFLWQPAPRPQQQTSCSAEAEREMGGVEVAVALMLKKIKRLKKNITQMDYCTFDLTVEISDSPSLFSSPVPLSLSSNSSPLLALSLPKIPRSSLLPPADSFCLWTQPHSSCAQKTKKEVFVTFDFSFSLPSCRSSSPCR